MKIPCKSKLSVTLATAVFALNPISSAIAATFNYGEALQKAIFFYDIQRLGKVSEGTGDLANRVYWRGDSFLQDYALPNEEGVVDLGGGFADAGDNVKFNFPMAASTTLLAWSVIEFRGAFEKSNQLKPMLANLRWAANYLLKSWDTKNQRLYGQVSPDSVQAEHSNLWMPFEVIDQASIDKNLRRFAFYVDQAHPGTDLAGETVAALTATSLAFQATDPIYAGQLLAAAKSIYQTLVNVPTKGKYSDNLGRRAGGSWKKADISSFYNSWSGYNDEVSWAAVWLYRGTQDVSYLNTAKQFVPLGNKVATLSWDDKSYGTYLLLAKFLPDTDPVKASAKASAEGWLNAWSRGTDGHVFSRDGLAISTALSPWGNARYAATTAFGALIYDAYFATNTYDTFAKNQIDYLLGNNSKGFSYEEGFGTKYPRRSHHATAQGRWGGNNDVGLREDNRHIAYGALVGGPKDTNDTYEDDRSDYIGNEIALDYNAGFVGALAALYGEYGGTPLPNDQFPPTRALEKPPTDEIFVNGSVQSGRIDNNQATVQVLLLATNHSAWPARVTRNLKIKYFVNLSDKPANGTVKVQTFSTDPRAVISTLKLYDAEKQIYYIEVWFKDIPIYPGGDERAISSKETQLQFQFSWAHDYTKDWSYQGLGSQNNLKVARYVPIYDVIEGSDKLLFGNEPVSQPQGILKLNFAANLPQPCLGAKDTLVIGQNDSPVFTIGMTPFSYSMPLGGPFNVSLNSTANPLTVEGGTCQGGLNANQANVPGQLTANYTFRPTPPVEKGTIQVVPSAQSDPKCNNASDTLFLDQETTGRAFTVAQDGISVLVPTGTHQVKLTSQSSIPASGGQAGYCTSTLNRAQVNVTKDQASIVSATYQYHNNDTGMSCSIVDAKITQQSDWGSAKGLVNTFEVKFTVTGFPKEPNGRTLLDGSFTLKNDFVQNFWGNFGMSSSSFNLNVGQFKGEIWPNQLPVSLSGFIFNKNPMKVGENPLQSMTIGGVVCR
ncbi:MAG: glycoside hydrolase family 9 protein [Gammaproteobacteria bacterium]|nr:glycoside hydrolase family 9 protein [Gammaproteobacteria bacterium]